MRFLCVALALGLLGGAPLHAENVSTEVKKLYRSGTNHYELSEFDAALADFREAYRVKDDPIFLYNIAQCYRQLKQEEQAVQFYKSFLRRVPDTKNRAEVESRITVLEASIAARPAPAVEPAPMPAPAPEAIIAQPQVTEVVAAPPPPKKPLYKKWWLWTTIGAVVVVGVGVGLGVGLTRSSSSTSFAPVTF